MSMPIRTARESAAVAVDVPERCPGPVTAQRLRRTKLVYGIVAGLGFMLALMAPSSSLRSFGLGLMFPGAGFLQYLAGSWLSVVLHLVLAIGSLLLFILAVVGWWWCGNVLLMPAVWLGAAVGAAVMGHHHTFGGSLLLTLALVASVIALETARGRRVARREAADLARRRSVPWQDGALGTPRVDPRSGLRVAKELSVTDLAALRFALDRALQPVGEFGGFHFGDQWQLSATRYQVFTLGWALALANHNCLPAMRGYLQEAQLNLIEKTKDHRLWAYWWWENLWGNFRLGADPLAHDNIMFSGYMGKQIGMYQAATGDLRHDAPGAYTLATPRGERFVYDFPSIVETLASQFERSSFCLWPCEPNWIYLFCNGTGANAVRAYDAAHGTHLWDRVATSFERAVRQEFTRPNGDVSELRSAYFGFTPPFMIGPGVNVNAAAELHGILPTRAERLWQISRPELLESTAEGTRMRATAVADFDPGNLKRSAGFGLGTSLHAAREFGDEEFAGAVQAAIDEHAPSTVDGGVLTHTNVSIWAHALLLMGRVGAPNGLADLVTKGTDRRILSGPMLSRATYPDVLVALATNDGRALDLVLHPGRTPGMQTIALAGLHSNSTYRCDGAESKEIRSDARGEATIGVLLEGRTEIRVVPAP